MGYRKAKMSLVAAGIALGVSSAVIAEDGGMLGASGALLANTCAGCHGTNGVSQGPAVPTISGMAPAYFIDVMTSFASGDAYSTIMGRIAKGYSEDEIAAMADYFGALPFVTAKQEFDAAAVEKGAKIHDKYCEKCHSDAGSLKDDESGILAGQWVPYLKWTLDDYIAGHRMGPKKMTKKLVDLMEEEGADGLHAVISFYASKQ